MCITRIAYFKFYGSSNVYLSNKSFYLWSYQEYLYTDIHLYSEYSVAASVYIASIPIVLLEMGKNATLLFDIFGVSLKKPWVWFDRKAQIQSFILSLTIYRSCFRDTSARRKHESITYTSLRPPFSSQNISMLYTFRPCILSYMFTNLWKILRIVCNLLSPRAMF